MKIPCSTRNDGRPFSIPLPTVALKHHPSTPCALVSGFEVDVERPRANVLRLRYAIHGDISRLLFPEGGEILRCDELWRHTCCEAFLKTRDTAAYYEFNFSPAAAWGLYRFSSYRQGMTKVPYALPPEILTGTSAQDFELEARINLAPLTRSDQILDLALSGVIETREGKLSYWALRHPPGQPDFHHPDAFALDTGRPFTDIDRKR